MTDDLVKRLRDADEYNGKHYVRDPLHKQAADRIEQLEERLKAATDDAKEAEAYAEELEATYNEITLDIDEDGIWLIDNTDQGDMQMGHVSWRQIAIHVQKELAELKGESG